MEIYRLAKFLIEVLSISLELGDFYLPSHFLHFLLHIGHFINLLKSLFNNI